MPSPYAATVEQDLQLTRDARGQISAKQDALGEHSFQYDERGQLVDAEHAGSGIPSESYTYDSDS